MSKSQKNDVLVISYYAPIYKKITFTRSGLSKKKKITYLIHVAMSPSVTSLLIANMIKMDDHRMIYNQ